MPHIKFVNPREDVCANCEILRKQIAAATVEVDKIAAGEAFADHVRTAQQERSFYRQAVQASRDDFEEHGQSPQKVHYTFDFAQSDIFSFSSQSEHLRSLLRRSTSSAQLPV